MSSLMYSVGYSSISGSGSLTTGATVNEEGINKKRLGTTLVSGVASTLTFGRGNNVSAVEVINAKDCIEAMSDEQLAHFSSLLAEKQTEFTTSSMKLPYTKKL